MTRRRVFIDAEFTALPWNRGSTLLWLGLADESGRTWSAVNRDAELSSLSDFSREVVVPRITAAEPQLSLADMAPAVIDFCGSRVEFWAWCPTVADLVHLGVPSADAPMLRELHWDYDFTLLRRVVIAWSGRWSASCGDVQQYARDRGLESFPTNPNPHHPAYDALWAAEVYRRATQLIS